MRRPSRVDRLGEVSARTKDSMEETLRRIVAKIAESSQEFPPGADLREELGLDSVRLIEVFFEIERDFQVVVPQERFANIQTFEDLLALVKSIKQ